MAVPDPERSHERGEFVGQTVLVTGAGSGIGEASVRAFAACGARVIVADVSSSAEAVAQDLSTQGVEAIAAIGDLTHSGDVERVVARSLARFGRIDVLVNGAGGFSGRVPTWEISEDEWDSVIDLNLKSAFLCCREVVPSMIDHGGGRIVNVASSAGRATTQITGSHYAAANAGVLGLTRHLAHEAGRYQITVNCVTPGPTLTPRIERLYTRAQRDDLAATVPLGRIAEPGDISGPILFLASDAARYITGATLDVNGGRLAI
jgi:NAD(P)-dependent dehydrogenase (short-subunit alcohol dehydrogenase family)